MKCADPKLCYTDSNGKKHLRHFSLASSIIKQTHQQVFDCGTCLHCRKKKAYELARRCVLHASLYKENCFLTLTYDEKKEGYHNEFQYEDIQKFKKRLRSFCRRKCNGKRIEIFNVHEYGKNGKKHWHLVVFNHSFEDRLLFTSKRDIPLYTSRELEKLWKFGFSSIGDVNIASAMYQAQYMEKDIKNGNSHNKRKSKSIHKGLGGLYFLKHYRQILRLGYIPFEGKKMPIPRYFQKLAHKHYCHFYDKTAFFDNKNRKAPYRPFKPGQENKEIADLFVEYKKMKDTYIQELEQAWDRVISQHLTTSEIPDFIKSASNSLYDLKKKQQQERF